MARQLLLNESQDIVIVLREEEIINTNKISIDSVIDDGNKVMARVSFFNTLGLSRNLVLWEGQDYINIRDWTDSDVDSRIKEILNIV